MSLLCVSCSKLKNLKRFIPFAIKVIKMGRKPCCDKEGLKKGPWTPEEDEILLNISNKTVMEAGEHFQRKLVKIIFFPLLDFGLILDSFHGQEFSYLLGLLRCGKSCRLRWTNYLRPDIKRVLSLPRRRNSLSSFTPFLATGCFYIV